MKKLLCLLFALSTINSFSQVCFGAPKKWGVGFSLEKPFGITSGDFNGDGNVDIITANTSVSSISLMIGGGGFGLSSTFATANGPTGVWAADFNKDRKMDVAVTNANSNSVYIFSGNGTGNLSVTNTVSVGSNPMWITSAYLNNDTFPDLAVSIHNSTTICVLLNDSTGKFPHSSTYTVSGQPSDIIASDFNNDGSVDLAVGVGSGIDILFGTGTGSFGSATNYSGMGWDLTSGDLNGDGKLDLAGSPKQGSQISIYPGNGAGVFGPVTSFTTANDANSVSAGDINNDGTPDLVVAHEVPTNQLSVFTGNGNGTFTQAFTLNNYPMNNPKQIITTDLNSDGKDDIGFTNISGNEIVTLFQLPPAIITASATSTAVCFGDSVTFTGSGGNSYSWSHGVNNASPYAPSATANYTVTGSDINGCSDTDTITVTVLSKPTVTANSTATLVCVGNAVIFTGGGAATYTWTGGVTNGSPFIVNATQTFTVTGTAANTCTNSASISVSIRTLPPAPDICEVTADSLSINNLIYWDKTLYPSADSFYIYRDTANYNYLLIGVQPYSALSVYIDTARHICTTVNGDPKITYYKYKIAYRDTCGAMSPMSPYHQSVYMYNTGGLFQWNHYEIEGQPTPVPGLTQYRLMRDNFATGTYTLAAGASASSLLISDPQYSTYQTTADWRIETQWNISCTPSLRQSNNGVQGAVVKSRSNVKNNRTTSIAKTESLFSIYPNPAAGNFTIEMPNGKKRTAHVFDVTGHLVLTQEINGTTVIDITGLYAGVYYVGVNDLKKKLVVIK